MKIIPSQTTKMSSTRLYGVPENIKNSEIIKKISVFSGDDIGFPIYMFQYIFTNLHYGKTVDVPNLLKFLRLLYHLLCIHIIMKYLQIHILIYLLCLQ